MRRVKFGLTLVWLRPCWPTYCLRPFEESDLTTSREIQRAVLNALGNIAQWEWAIRTLPPEGQRQAAPALLDDLNAQEVKKTATNRKNRALRLRKLGQQA